MVRFQNTQKTKTIIHLVEEKHQCGFYINEYNSSTYIAVLFLWYLSIAFIVRVLLISGFNFYNFFLHFHFLLFAMCKYIYSKSWMSEILQKKVIISPGTGNAFSVFIFYSSTAFRDKMILSFYYIWKIFFFSKPNSSAAEVEKIRNEKRFHDMMIHKIKTLSLLLPIGNSSYCLKRIQCCVIHFYRNFVYASIWNCAN